MALLVSDVATEVAIWMNDASAATFTLTRVIPFIKIAYQELGDKMIEIGVPPTREVSAPIDVAASASESAVTLPADLISPISLEERVDGEGNDKWIPMDEVDTLPVQVPSQRLGFWVWTEEALKVPASTQANEVRITYWRILNTLAAGGDAIAVLGSKTFLSKRTAGIIARNVTEDTDRADRLDKEASMALEILLNTKVLAQQNLGVRRLPYRGRRG